MKKKLLLGMKQNNKGMTLVEVLVAMIILSVAGVTFLQSFSYATKNNVAAREKQHALVLAQSMMETAKAYSIKELDEDKDANGNSIFGVYTLGNVNAADITGTGDDTVHTYKLDTVSFNGYSYDVVMTAKKSSSANNSGIIANVHDPNNSTDAFYLEEIDSEQDQVMQAVWNELIASEGVYPGIKDYFENGYSEASFLDKAFLNVNKRTIKISIDNDGTNYSVSLIVEYDVNIAEFDYIKASDGSTVHYPGVTSFSVSVNTGVFYAEPDLDNLYFCYYPMYKRISTAVSTPVEDQWLMCNSDNIEITNDSGKDINLYLLRQRLPKIPSVLDTTLQSYESSYMINVSGFGSNGISMYHNLDKDLITDNSKNADTSYKLLNAGVTDKTALYEKKTENLVYDIQVDVYEAGEAESILTINGSTNGN